MKKFEDLPKNTRISIENIIQNFVKELPKRIKLCDEKGHQDPIDLPWTANVRYTQFGPKSSSPQAFCRYCFRQYPRELTEDEQKASENFYRSLRERIDI